MRTPLTADVARLECLGFKLDAVQFVLLTKKSCIAGHLMQKTQIIAAFLHFP
jgi:hypothetical protein